MTIYRGVGGVNREIKQQFRGIGGINREIKEQYRGISGVNRKVFCGKLELPILYDSGKENEYIGWRASSNNQGSIIVQKLSTSLHCCSNKGGANNSATLITVNQVDLTPYKLLRFNLFDVSTTSTNTFRYAGQIGISSVPNPDWYFLQNSDGSYGRVKSVHIYDDNIPAVLDISNLKGNYYVYMGSNEGSADWVRQFKASKIWLE